MTHNLIGQKSWLQYHWKWFVPTTIVTIWLIIFFSSGMNKVASDLTYAYSDTELFDNALEKVMSNDSVIAILGDIKPIDKLAILEGQVNYSEDNSIVKSTIRITASKGKARLDILANKVNSEWDYQTISVRIKQPKNKRQTIAIISEN